MPYSSIRKKTILPKKTQTKNKKKRFSFSVSFPGLCISVIIAVLTLSWSFIFGVIIGRGYNPEQKLSTLTQLLPESTITQNDPKIQQVLKPEDLNFMTALKQDYKPTLDKHNQQDNKIASTSISLENQPEKNKDIEQTNKEKSEKIQTLIAQDKKEKTTIQKNTMIYDFIFQVASFKKEEQANSLREKLEEKGIRTQLTVKNIKNIPCWYHVRVLLRGLETDADSIKAIFTHLKLSDARCISKEPTGKHR